MEQRKANESSDAPAEPSASREPAAQTPAGSPDHSSTITDFSPILGGFISGFAALILLLALLGLRSLLQWEHGLFDRQRESWIIYLAVMVPAAAWSGWLAAKSSLKGRGSRIHGAIKRFSICAIAFFAATILSGIFASFGSLFETYPHPHEFGRFIKEAAEITIVVSLVVILPLGLLIDKWIHRIFRRRKDIP